MAKSKDDYRSLSGPQKAAVFMLAVGREHSSKIFERMDDEEIRELSHAMSTLGSVGAAVVERLFVEFADQFPGFRLTCRVDFFHHNVGSLLLAGVDSILVFASGFVDRRFRLLARRFNFGGLFIRFGHCGARNRGSRGCVRRLRGGRWFVGVRFQRDRG